MVILDLNQITFSNLFMASSKLGDITEENLRYMILNSIRAYNCKLFHGKGEIIIACDSRKNWRKDVFPYYKANRKKERATTKIDWESVFPAFETIKSELKEYFSYTVIDVEGAEADDIIATITLDHPSEKILIVSGDTDFVQLHDGFFVDQFNPIGKKYISVADPKTYLKQHIIEGDRSDGIPNIASADDTFVLGNRQGVLNAKKIKYLTDTDPNDFPSVYKRNWQRNQQLIDLTFIPSDVRESIRDQFASRPKKTNHKLFNYFVDKGLRKFADSIQEF